MIIKPNLWQRVKAFGKSAAPQVARKTIISGGPPKYFSPEIRNNENLRKWRDIYEQGGIISEAIDAYPLAIWSKGYRLEGGEAEKTLVQDRLDTFDLVTQAKMLITEALVCGDGFAENVQNVKGDAFACLEVKPAEMIQLDQDIMGTVTGYKFVPDTTLTGKTVPLALEDITRLTLIRSPRNPYGTSLIKRAIDEITRDTKTAEGSAGAIERHGFPKWLINATAPGTPDRPAESLDEETAKKIEHEFEELKYKSEFIADGDIKATAMDTGGVQNIQQYNDVMLQRLCAAIGVPREILQLTEGGLGTGGPSVRMDVWYDKIEAMQQQVARCLNLNVIDRITGRSGSVKIVFNNPRPKNFIAEATAIAALRQGMDPDAVCPADYARERLGIPKDESAIDKVVPEPQEKKKTPEELRDWLLAQIKKEPNAATAE